MRLILAATLVAVLAPSSYGDTPSLGPEVEPFVKVNAPIVVLRHVRVVDGTGAAPRDEQTIVIRNGRIQALGNASTAVPSGATVLDLKGYTVLPGLVGMHDHLFYPAPVPSEMSLEVAYTFPRLYLASGVTTIRTAGSVEPYTDLEVKRLIDEGRMVGPKIHVTGPFLQGQGASNPQMHQLRGPDDARKTVAFWADQGATSFKAYTNITREELAAAISVAHGLGLKVTGHLCSVGFREAIALGIDNLEHGPFFTDSEFAANKKADQCPSEVDRVTGALKLRVESATIRALIQDLVAHHVAVTSTLAVEETNGPNRPAFQQRAAEALIPELVADFLALRVQFSDPNGPIPRYFKMPTSPWPKILKLEMAFERAFSKAGGLLLAGADPTGQGGVLAGFGDQREIELLVEAGFTPVEAIHIATANGADFLGEGNRIGTIAVGKQADLVVIHGDPTRVISDIEKVEIVFKDGVGYDSKKLIESVRGAVGLR